MRFLQWSDQYKTGILGVDREHKELFSYIKDFSEAAAEQASQEKLSDLLEFLVNYTMQHFSAEEVLMRRASYPRFEEHKAAHEALVEKVTDLVREFQSQNGLKAEHISDFLTEWWSHHVLEEDFAYIPWVAPKPRAQ